jgi:hypothetical protein
MKSNSVVDISKFGFSTDLSAINTFMPKFKQSSSKALIKCTPGEKHALISFISSGIKYPPSPLDPNLMRSN